MPTFQPIYFEYTTAKSVKLGLGGLLTQTGCYPTCTVVDKLKYFFKNCKNIIRSAHFCLKILSSL